MSRWFGISEKARTKELQSRKRLQLKLEGPPTAIHMNAEDCIPLEVKHERSLALLPGSPLFLQEMYTEMIEAYTKQGLKECSVPACTAFSKTPGGWWMTTRVYCTAASALAALNGLDVKVDALGVRDVAKDPFGESKEFLAYRPSAGGDSVPAVSGAYVYLERFRTNYDFREWLDTEFVSCFNKVFHKLEPSHALCQADGVWTITRSCEEQT